MTDPAQLPPEPLLEAAKPWLSRPNVVGLSLGPKVTGGRETGEPALLVYVERKQPAAEVEFLVPELLTVGGAAVPTDVQEVGEIRTEVLDQRVRPVPGGYQIEAENIGGTGTLGVSINWGGKYRALTNNHVISNNGNLGAAVYQPDKGNNTVIGTVDGYVPVATYASKSQSNPVWNNQDLAYSQVTTAVCSPLIHLIGQPTGLRAPVPGETVALIGKQTARVRTAAVVDIVTTLTFQWAKGTSKPWAFFERLVRLDGVYTQPGDSGTAYVATSDMKVVALHVGAGSAFSFGCQLWPF